MAIANLIHKTDVYFEVVEPVVEKDMAPSHTMEQMHHGEIYIYLDQIYLFDGKRWYRAGIQDIKDIKSIAPQKQILIQFYNFDLVLFCKEYSHLLALRDFLYLSQKSSIDDNFMIKEPSGALGGGYHY